MSSFSSVDLPEPLSPTIATILPAGMLRLSFSSTGVRQPYRKRSEEHTSELQSRLHIVCRLLLEKKNRLHACRTAWRVRRPPPISSSRSCHRTHPPLPPWSPSRTPVPHSGTPNGAADSRHRRRRD